jgi:Putative peptidoglycan binding domain
MLVRERIDPHFGAAREALPHGEALRAGGFRATGRSRDWTASPAAVRPRPLRALGGLGGLRRLRGVPWLGRWSKRDVLAALIGIGAAAAVATNALMLQPGPHPAPIFAIKPKPAPPPAIAHNANGAAGEAMAQLSRSRPAEIAKPGPASEPAHPADGVPLPRPRSRPQNPPNAASHADPIADIIDPARQVRVVQRVLNEFGYGPLKMSGTFDDDTRNAIARFERDHNLPVTGQNSPRLRQALSIATGRVVE